MERIFLLLFSTFPFILASPVVEFNDASSVPAEGNGFVYTSSERPLEFVTISTPIAAVKDSEIRFGHRQPVLHKPVQPHYVPHIPEHHSPIIPTKFPEVLEEKPFILKHNPVVIPKEEIPVSPVIPIIPSPHIPCEKEHGVIPVTEDDLPVQPRHRSPHKPKHRRPHVPKHPRKHLPHLPKHHRKIPIIPDDTKHHRLHLVPKHIHKTDRKDETVYDEENKI